MKTRILHTYDAECDKCKGVCTHDASKSQPAKRTRKVQKEYCQWHETMETPAECSMKPTIATDKPQPTKQSADTSTDKIMLSIAIADTLKRDGYEDSTVQMVFKAVNSHEELLRLIKRVRKDYVESEHYLPADPWIIQMDKAIAKAESV